MSKSDINTLKRGLKRMGFALLTAALFALSAGGFVVTAIAPGYLAVVLFLTSVVGTAVATTLLYAQGITRRPRTESKGERNE